LSKCRTPAPHRRRANSGTGDAPIFIPVTNPIESTFATVRNRTKVTKGPGSRAAGLAMAFKLIQAAQDRWRAVNAPHLVALARAGATFNAGKLVKRPDENTRRRLNDLHPQVLTIAQDSVDRRRPAPGTGNLKRVAARVMPCWARHDASQGRSRSPGASGTARRSCPELRHRTPSNGRRLSSVLGPGPVQVSLRLPRRFLVRLPVPSTPERARPRGPPVPRRPCRLGGTSLDRPTNPATFAGATINRVFGYPTTDDTLRAVYVR
jgi:hypothetical protein